MIHIEVEQNTPEWFAARLGKPTASAASNMVTSKGVLSKSITGYAAGLAAELYRGEREYAFKGNKYTEHGHYYEPEALLQYEVDYLDKVHSIGFCLHDSKEFGCSPDAIKDDGGLVQVKCQYADGHIESLDYMIKNGRPKTDKVAQLHFEMLVMDAPYNDLYHFYAPPVRFDENGDPVLSVARSLKPFRIRVHRDKAWDAHLNSAIKECLKLRDSYFKTLAGKIDDCEVLAA